MSRWPTNLDIFLHWTILLRSLAQLAMELEKFPSYSSFASVELLGAVFGWIGVSVGLLGVFCAHTKNAGWRVLSATLAAGYCAVFVVQFAEAQNWSAATYVGCFVLGYSFSVVQLSRGVW